MSLKNLVSNTIAICILILLFLIAFTWIIFDFNQSSSSLKDSLSIVSSLFGGVSTLVAAYIASKLFNDWKEQHNEQVLAFEAKENFKLLHKERDIIHELKFTCEDILSGKSTINVSFASFATAFQDSLLSLFNENKDLMSSFCFLSKGQDIYKVMKNYHSEISRVAEILDEHKSKPYSHTTFLTSETVVDVLSLIKEIESKNGEVLDELKKYIFVK